MELLTEPLMKPLTKSPTEPLTDPLMESQMKPLMEFWMSLHSERARLSVGSLHGEEMPMT